VSDEADRAQVAEEIARMAALKRRKATLLPVGRCHNCDEPIRSGLFCDADCREDHEKRERMK